MYVDVPVLLAKQLLFDGLDFEASELSVMQTQDFGMRDPSCARESIETGLVMIVRNRELIRRAFVDINRDRFPTARESERQSERAPGRILNAFARVYPV